MASYFTWGPTYDESIRIAEERLLNSIDWGDASFTTIDVPITFGGEAHTIHTISASHPCDNTTNSALDVNTYPIVLWHGYAQGAGSWWRCLPGLAKSHSSQGNVYALDWIGVGASSRPTWTAGDCPTKAEEWFVDSLEQWRIHQGYEKIHLVAHSLSAFIATRYAEKYPQRLESLVYASPAGVPPAPGNIADNPRFNSTITRRTAVRTVRYLWTSGHTPQSVTRSLGRLIGKSFVVDGYVNRRFPDTVPSKEEFAEYMYQHWQGTPSGENSLNALLQFGAHAKEPLCHRIPQLHEDIPITFIYGRHDWMDAGAAKRVKEDIKAGGSRKTCNVHIVDECGHQLYIENPDGFNEVLLMYCQPKSRIDTNKT